jgi:3-phenylpropionate/trans-cinnamate dioxygenase ferredoxin reductase subunit
VVSDRAVDILLIGGGMASAAAAAELRAGGFDGSLTLVTREQDPPYHRPPITKGYLRGSEDRASTLVHPESWYADNAVELLTRTPVMDLDTEARTAKLGRELVGFGQALVATGAMVRRLRAEGAQREGIHYLRALGNADALRADLEQAQRVAIVGGSYIATEVAASLTLLGKQCTLVMQEALPTERGFGAVAGAFVRDLMLAHGVEIVAEADVAQFAGAGEEGPVGAVVCADGRRVEADLVVVGAGAIPDVMLARKAGLELGESGGVACDSGLRTSVEGVFAAGDMCEYDSVIHRRRLRIEHEEVAAEQGRHVARAILGAGWSFSEVPYFWSDLADWATIEYVGPAATWDEEIVRGDPASGSFSVFFLHGGTVAAALAVDRAEDLDAARSFLAEGAGADAVRALA